MTSRAIVTGGAGFIGSHVVDSLLGDGYEVTVVDDLSAGDASRVPAEADLHELDIVEFDRLCALIEELKPDAIFHLAAQASVVASVANPGRDCEVNVMGTLNVVESAGRVGAPVVFTSTGGALYGDDAPMPTPEDRIPSPLSPYGASKLAGEAYVNTWSLSSGIPHAVCRLGNVYGPRQNPHGEAGVVAIFSDHLYTGKTPKLYGHGKPTRDYVYVGDVVKALRAASGKSGTYNVATSVETDVMTIWRGLQSAAEQSSANGATGAPGSLQPELADLRPGELQHSRLDIARAEKELGWRPEVAIEQGLRETYEALVKDFEQQR
ncbi:MAG TPA: NAD-dependent epimerase/dehydratase family protein [Solirubrobacteraceae bacterium]|nr:NAD-dependent epimerase/dehydratase family protein [Solirubrobacteraceae bacterium]